ncbi:glycosyl hydrolase family 61-domain-containing protein [Gymnopilus junonius]|uniref:lytic cellulose monooxygenase (C4-dehydrogenating) n=1 Tax=Gymnopilus junonius TaxID=109634 RepID=A0A9P5TNJ8_GYMJU|nr:glycosyl hydrolase family 61-domain-containing protein [Gymnopilus junonius]
MLHSFPYFNGQILFKSRNYFRLLDTFPDLIVGGKNTGDWHDFRCYTSQTNAVSQTASVAAGSSIGITADGPIYHPGVINVYMAKAPNNNVASWDGSGEVWFFQISAVTDGGSTIEFPGTSKHSNCELYPPKALPSGQYLLRVEQIALHVASTYGGAQFYLSCAQVQVTNGGSGTPGPLVAIPGVYTGYEPGILLNIYYPVPATYIQPGPAVWSG